MNTKYLLAPILQIRRRRQDEAERNVARARQEVALREKALADRKREEHEYTLWCENEAAGLYGSLEEGGSDVTNQDIVMVRDQIKWNEGFLVHYQKQTEDAAIAVAGAREGLSKAEKQLHKAMKEVVTIEEHQTQWKEEVQAEEAYAEESELEEIAMAQFFRRSETT